MNPSLYILYGISLVCIVLGFTALLKQKTYIDSETKEPTEVELPILGKMKTNYPSLIFLAMGIFLAAFVFNKSYSPTKRMNDWVITGRLVDTTHSIDNFSFGELKIIPKDVEDKISPNGTFEIRMQLEEGHEFEDEVENITYTNKNFSVYLQPSEEKKKKDKNDNSSMLDRYTKRTRTYKPVILTNF